ncbi:MAG: hypothetical protein ACYTGX_04450 [Planctomycetota bacterium]|jgi:hypothetical protein
MDPILQHSPLERARRAVARACRDLDAGSAAEPLEPALTIRELRDGCRRLARRLTRFAEAARREIRARGASEPPRRSSVRARERLATWVALGGTLVRASDQCADPAELARSIQILLERIRLGLEDGFC